MKLKKHLNYIKKIYKKKYIYEIIKKNVNETLLYKINFQIEKRCFT